MSVLVASILHTVRQFRVSRVFTAAVVLMLALGIGGTTAIFALIDAVMLRPLPVSDPARLYRIGDGDDTTALGRHGRWGLFSVPLYERLKAATPEFENVAAFDWGGTLLGVRRQGENVARPLRVGYVTGSYFSTLGVGAFAGRVLTADDDRRSAPPAIVLSHRAWQVSYGGDRSVVGSTFVVEGHPFTAVGVAAAGFFGLTVRSDPPDIWIPLSQEPTIAGAGSLLHQSISPWLFVVGRLRRDASVAAMPPRLSEILRQWIRGDAGYPSNWMPDILRDLPEQTVAVVPAGAGIGLAGLSVKEQYGPSLQILLAICGLVLLIACANVANLLLARAVARRAQVAVRMALGATRRQIVAEALAESVLLALAGSLAGLVVAMGAERLLLALAFRSAQFVPITTAPSPGVLAFAAGLALATAGMFGAAPAWFATRSDPVDALRGRVSSTGDRSSRSRTGLLVVQAALSVVLVASAALLARSLENLQRQDFGYQLQGRVAVGLTRLPAAYTQEQLSVLYRDIDQRLARIPGVGGSGVALYNPLASNWNETVVIDGHAQLASDQSSASWDRVSANYLQALGVTVVRGRSLTPADNETTGPVAVVNEAFVERFFRKGEDPLGRYFGIALPQNARTFRIVGVVGDAKFARSGLSGPARAMFYLPMAQHVDYQDQQLRLVERLSHFAQGIVLATAVPPGRLEPLLRKTLADADPNLTITSVRTMPQQIGLSFDRERAVATLAELFGLVALVLAAVGVYGVTAYMVGQQTNEIGIRMALGADRAKVMQLVLFEALERVAVGLVVGLPLAVVAARLMAAQLYGVSVRDPFALALAAGSLAVFAFVAATIPAGRAAAISPMSALRRE
jgi:predicted permease